MLTSPSICESAVGSPAAAPRRRRRQVRVERRHARGQFGVVDLHVARQHHRHDRDADRRADVAHQAEQARRVGPEARVERGEGDGRQRNEHQPEAQPLDDAGLDDQVIVHLRREAGHDVERVGREHEPEHHEIARIHPVDDAPDQHHRDHGADAARRHDEAGGDGRIAEDRRQHRRQQRQARQQDDADDEDEDQPGREIAVDEDLRVDERVLRGQRDGP